MRARTDVATPELASKAEAPQSAAEDVITVDECAALLRIDRKTLYNVINAGEIPGVRRLGRSIRLHRGTVLRWLAEGQGRAPRSRSSR